ncbi:MAG: RraA family protein [Thaumarchaeota archaeon]|nr:RraA family protein [Nitrososphaerota archaeon]
MKQTTKALDSRTKGLLEVLSGMYVAAVSDILDDMGFNNQVMVAGIKAVNPETKLVGVALPVETTWYKGYKKFDDFSYEPLFKIFDGISPGCVITIATEGRTTAACWGELVSNAARGKGAAGFLTDGCVRDIEGILDISPPFPVFALGYNPARSEGRLEYGRTNIPLVCGGVRVEPGDIIFGDRDGVVVIPKKVADKVVKKAEDTVSRESAFRSDIRKGTDLRATIEKYGVA